MTAAAEGGIIYSTETEEEIPVTAAFETKRAGNGNEDRR